MSLSVPLSPMAAQAQRPVLEQQMSLLRRDLGRVVTAIEDLNYRNAHIEMRAMNDNMKPHEFVRKLITICFEFSVDGDGSWPLRSSGFPKGFFRVAYGFPKVFLRFFEWLPKVFLMVFQGFSSGFLRFF